MPTHGTYDAEISLAKGIIFTKIGLANGAILKLWVAHPYTKYNREPPLSWHSGGKVVVSCLLASGQGGEVSSYK